MSASDVKDLQSAFEAIDTDSTGEQRHVTILGDFPSVPHGRLLTKKSHFAAGRLTFHEVLTGLQKAPGARSAFQDIQKEVIRNLLPFLPPLITITTSRVKGVGVSAVIDYQILRQVRILFEAFGRDEKGRIQYSDFLVRPGCFNNN